MTESLLGRVISYFCHLKTGVLCRNSSHAQKYFAFKLHAPNRRRTLCWTMFIGSLSTNVNCSLCSQVTVIISAYPMPHSCVHALRCAPYFESNRNCYEREQMRID